MTPTDTMDEKADPSPLNHRFDLTPLCQMVQKSTRTLNTIHNGSTISISPPSIMMMMYQFLFKTHESLTTKIQ
jgi:hypothetical protein